MTPALDDALYVLWARQTIHDALLRYARGLDRLDVDTVASAYYDDGLDHNGGSPVTGRQFATETVEMLRQTYLSTSHLLSNSLVAVERDAAHAETYYTAWHRFARANQLVDLLIAGRYLDRFERRGDEWKIAYRWRVRDWSRVDPVLETREPPPGWPLGQRSRADPLYALLLEGER